jgi:ribosomal protein L23
MDDELTLTFYQYRNFDKETIRKALGNIYNIKSRIVGLSNKLNTIQDNSQIEKIKKNIENLEMSKESIIYYYGLNVIV